MIGRIVRDHRHAGDACDAIGVALEGRIPEILRIVLLADEEAEIGRHADRAQKRARMRPSPVEPSGRFASRSKSNCSKWPMPAFSNDRDVGRRILAFETSIDSPARAPRKSRVKAPNENERGRRRHDQLRLADLEQFDEITRELHDPIVRAPGMTVARADREAGTAVELAGRVEIADGVHDVIEAVGQAPLTSPTRTRSAPAAG